MTKLKWYTTHGQVTYVLYIGTIDMKNQQVHDEKVT